MKIKLLFILLNSAFLFGQKPVELKIESLTSVDETKEERTFTINYSITNKTDKTIHFILNPNHLIPVSSGSMNPRVYYKVYENETSIDLNGLFFEKGENIKTSGVMLRHNDSIRIANLNRILEEQKKYIIKNIQELKPNETREYSTTFNWDKNRYFKNDVMEYYIDEKEPHFYELHINLMKEELLSKFSEEEKNEILKDKNFIKGWFTSNKVEINFRE
ncbi:hypothetical protein [Flavobacterium macrobrachii]|uniref:hypothetical protein n=1 Tax=Flavobacterium macrobrachii TaxID=591204 RepID=UPI003F722B03